MDGFIYTTTDANEVRELLSDKDKPLIKVRTGFDFEGYSFGFEEARVISKNLSVVEGSEIQKALNLSFNPMSYILVNGGTDCKERGELIKKLVKHGLFVAENWYDIRQYFPTKYNRYQGGGINR